MVSINLYLLLLTNWMFLIMGNYYNNYSNMVQISDYFTIDSDTHMLSYLHYYMLYPTYLLIGYDPS